MTAKSMQTKPSIVFCHGLWADGSCFSKVIPALQADGHQVIAAQYGLNTTADDVATVRSTLGRVSSPAILVGHSYGGSVITGAGTDDRVAGLVYIAALAPDADETSQTQQSNFPKTDVFSYIEVADGRIWLRPEGIDCFAGDLSEPEKKLVWATQCVPVPDLFNAKVGGTAWKSKPSWYIVAKNDRTVHPDLERFFAKRMGAKVTEVASSHVAMLSHPDVVIDESEQPQKPSKEPWPRRKVLKDFARDASSPVTVQLGCDDSSSSPAEQLQDCAHAETPSADQKLSTCFVFACPAATRLYASTAFSNETISIVGGFKTPFSKPRRSSLAISPTWRDVRP